MRIVLIGTQCSGKSTTAALLAEKLGLPLLEETARTVARVLEIRNDEELPIDLRYIWQIGILVLQLQKERELSSFISDRGTPDIMAYLHILARKDFSPVPDTYNAFLAPILRKAFYEYNYTFWLDPLPLQADGFRNTNPKYQQLVHNRIGEVLQEWGVTSRVLRVPIMPLEERVDMIYSHIINCGYKHKNN